MQRWLIILSVAMVQYPDLAAASTRSSNVPFWQRLLSILTPNSVSAARPVHQEPAARPVRQEPAMRPVQQEPAAPPVLQELAQLPRVILPPIFPDLLPAPPI